LHDCNPFAKYLQSLQEQFDDAAAGIHPTLPPPQYWIISILDHRLNENEMFALFDSRNNVPPDPNHTGIWIKSKGNAMKRLDMHNGCVPWLTFPLMFPCADQGWHMGIPINCEEVDNESEESLNDMPNDEASILDRLASAKQTPSWFELNNHQQSRSDTTERAPGNDSVITDIGADHTIPASEANHRNDSEPANMNDDIALPNADIREFVDTDNDTDDDVYSVSTLPSLATALSIMPIPRRLHLSAMSQWMSIHLARLTLQDQAAWPASQWKSTTNMTTSIGGYAATLSSRHGI